MPLAPSKMQLLRQAQPFEDLRFQLVIDSFGLGKIRACLSPKGHADKPVNVASSRVWIKFHVADAIFVHGRGWKIGTIIISLHHWFGVR